MAGIAGAAMRGLRSSVVTRPSGRRATFRANRWRARASRSTPFAQAPLEPRDLPRAEVLGMALKQCEDRRVRFVGTALQLLRRSALDRLPL